MASSDIYEVKESPWEKKAEPSQPRSRRRRHRKRFDETTDKNLSGTHRRRSRNSGFRRFQHRMKDPVFSKKFWLVTLGSAGLILLLLIVWDLFFRYPKLPIEQTPGVYRAVVD
jgi:hypothetical protein